MEYKDNSICINFCRDTDQRQYLFIGSPFRSWFFLEGGFLALFAGIVLPAAVMNTVIMLVVYPIVEGIMKRSKMATV